MGRGPGAALAHHLAWQWTGFLRTTKTTYEIPGSWPQGFGCSSSDEICHSAHFCFSEDFKVIERISSASWQPGTLSAEPRKVLRERGCIHRPTYYCIEPTALSFPDSWKLWPFLLVKQHESVCMCLCVCVCVCVCEIYRFSNWLPLCILSPERQGPWPCSPKSPQHGEWHLGMWEGLTKFWEISKQIMNGYWIGT